MTIPIALFVGFWLPHPEGRARDRGAAIGVALLLLTVIGSGSSGGSPAIADAFTLSPEEPRDQVRIAVYGFIASVLPVWLLLRPRDTSRPSMKIGTIRALAIGVLFATPLLHMPAMTKFGSSGGPIVPGQVFPFVFITITCGALSLPLARSPLARRPR